MMNAKKLLNQYILDHIDEEDPVLAELDRETNLNVLRPRMLSGKLQGEILEMLSKMISPKYILEIGTFTGYSAICLAKGLTEGGKLHTIEINDELKPIAKKYFKKSGLSDKIIQHTGNACEIIPSINLPFDLVFIDGDKREYLSYYDLIFDKLTPGGFIIADNILWSGKVVDTSSEKDEQTLEIMNFNEAVKNDSRVSKVILPIRDGLFLIQKKS